MSTPSTPDQLATQIEALVAGYIEQTRKSAHDAVSHAFARTLSVNGASKKPTVKASGSTPHAKGVRRTAAQLAQLADELHASITDAPGEAMVVFAERLGVGVRQLHRPMSKLKREGRIRSVGQRHLTRYFPTTGSRASA